MTKKMIPGAYATKIAQKMLPVIYQEIGFSRSNNDWKYDVPCEIKFGDFETTNQPVAYYWIRQDDEFYYVGYAFYHYLDYTHCPMGKVFGGEHRSDFEGVIIRVPKFNPDGKAPEPGASEIITVCHDKLLHDIHLGAIWIEFGGHGIHPEPYYGSKSYAVIQDYVKLINMDWLTCNYWDFVEKEFNPKVHLPWQWSDRGKYAGWMWWRPDELFRAFF